MRVLKLSLFAFLGLAACSSTSPGTGLPSSTSSSGTGGDDGGTGDTDGGAGGAAPTPITAPDDTWTWVPFDNAFCADGTSTGIGVNLNSSSTRVLIYLEPGGACWSDITCYSLDLAVNFTTGYSESTFKTDLAMAMSPSGFDVTGGFWDRSAPENPFADYNWVFVPYCTGDIHAGDNVVTYTDPKGPMTAHHVGYKNISAYLERLVPTFPKADRVILAGSSAGGFGAAVNWWQTQQAFGKIRVDLIDDSGTPMPPDVETTSNPDEPAQRAAWNVAATLPKGCTACATRLDAILGYYNSIYPDHRAALLSYTQDTVLPGFFGITQAAFTTGLQEEITTNFTPGATFKYFTNDAMGHVLWTDPQLTTGTVTLQQFLTQMVTDDASWASAP